MAEPISPARFADLRAFEREWAALRECVSPWSDKEGLRHYLGRVAWPRLLLLAEEHGVIGRLAASLNRCNEPAIPSEIKQTLSTASGSRIS